MSPAGPGMRRFSTRGNAGAGSSISVTMVRSCWRSSGNGGKYPGTRMDFTNSPTIWALGSIVRLPRRMRWPSRKRSASSSLIAVWDSSSFGCVRSSLMETLLLRGIVPSPPAVPGEHPPLGRHDHAVEGERHHHQVDEGGEGQRRIEVVVRRQDQVPEARPPGDELTHDRADHREGDRDLAAGEEIGQRVRKADLPEEDGPAPRHGADQLQELRIHVREPEDRVDHDGEEG